MKKRYSIPKEQCTCGISELYDNVAKILGISDVSKAVYDCRKLSITKKVLDCLYKFYHCMVQKQIWMVMATKSR